MEAGSSRLRASISNSEMPNSPIARGATFTPSIRSGRPNVIRGVLVIGSRPIVPRERPSAAISSAFASAASARIVTSVTPPAP